MTQRYQFRPEWDIQEWEAARRAEAKARGLSFRLREVWCDDGECVAVADVM